MLNGIHTSLYYDGGDQDHNSEPPLGSATFIRPLPDREVDKSLAKLMQTRERFKMLVLPGENACWSLGL